MAKPETADRLLSITELAAELGTTARAIRFYESKGLLDPQRAGGNRVYTYRDRARLLLILRGKRLGFSLAEVKEYLDLYDHDPTQKEQLVHLLRGARQRIAELEEQRRDLELTLAGLREVERQTLEAMAEHGLIAPPAVALAIGTNGRAAGAAPTGPAARRRVGAPSTDGKPADERGPRAEPPPRPPTAATSSRRNR